MHLSLLGASLALPMRPQLGGGGAGVTVSVTHENASAGCVHANSSVEGGEIHMEERGQVRESESERERE
jgi:hypothetical protein